MGHPSPSKRTINTDPTHPARPTEPIRSPRPGPEPGVKVVCSCVGLGLLSFWAPTWDLHCSAGAVNATYLGTLVQRYGHLYTQTFHRLFELASLVKVKNQRG